MIRTLLIILLMFFNLYPALAITAESSEKDINAVRETYKLRGQIEYDDNEVETIYLDDSIEKPKVNIPQKTLTVPVRILNITSNANTPRSALARSMTIRSGLTDIMPLSGSLAENIGGFSYGQTWGQELSYAQMEDTTSFFIKYNFPKYFSLTSSIRQAANQDIGTQYNILRIVPEWRISDRLTLKNSFSSYMNLPKNKNELTIVYTPSLKKYADSLKFELGVAQSYYKDGRQSSSMSLSTGFKL
ncbi:MAG: hypothetical protein MJ230_04125 [bacterium]|nr:hypothetical protein [bacterium]